MRRTKPTKFDAAKYDDIVSGVKAIYRDMVRPLEEQHLVSNFHYPLLTEQDFDAKPMVLLIGSYSVGKTSFIKYLLDQVYPGCHIGPEPTTDYFQAIMYGVSEREIPGHALVSNPNSPFHELSQFGNAFLSRFAGCEVPSDFAKGCTLIDTPGVLAGRKQTIDRQYSHEDVIKWFAPRCDMILLMFDAHKVDIADELKEVIRNLEGYDDKVRVVLNKADSLEPSEMLKINSALTWNLARILHGAEVRRIYVGSFWDQPLQPSYMSELFEKETAALLNDLASLPRNNTTAKLNDLVYRTRMVRVQALVLAALRSEMPKMGVGKDKKQRELIAGLEEVFVKVSRTHNIPPGDFPDVAKFRHTLATTEACRDFSKFKRLDDKLLLQLDCIIRDHVGALMSEFEAIQTAAPQLPCGGMREPEPKGNPAQMAWQPTLQGRTAIGPALPAPSLPYPEASRHLSRTTAPSTSGHWGGAGGSGSDGCGSGGCDSDGCHRSGGAVAAPIDPWSNASTKPADASSVVDHLFGRPGTGAGASAGPSAGPTHTPALQTAALVMSVTWAVTAAEKAKYDSIFQQMQPEEGRVGGNKVAPVLKRSGLSTEVLRDIWNLVDMHEDGFLDADWFAVAMHLTMKTKRGEPIPESLPVALIPPSCR